FAVWVFVRVVLDRAPVAGGMGRLISGVAVALLAAACLLLPMICYTYAFPAQVLQRSLTRTTSLETPLPQHVVSQFVDNVRGALLMFNWHGETNWFVCGDGRPMLDPVSAALFALGVGYL